MSFYFIIGIENYRNIFASTRSLEIIFGYQFGVILEEVSSMGYSSMRELALQLQDN